MLATINQYGASLHLSARAERPIESCEISPTAYVQIKGGSLDNTSRSRLQDPNNFYFTYTWYRGPPKSACCNPNCQRSESFEPTKWSKAALGGPELICNVCTATGYPAHESSFCTKSCFLTAWKEHSKKHSVIRKLSTGSEGGLSSPPNELVEDNMKLLSATTNPSDWKQIYEDKTYTPIRKDVGSRLRIDITAYSVADNSLLAGPFALFTEPVLATPKKSSIKRPLTAISHERTAVAGAIRFRIISYNILAEKYATKQAYPYCDGWNLSWPFRRKLLFEEIEEIQGDIVCLQEVQADHYENDINPFMLSLGYDGIYKQKSFLGQYGKIDGCATFWKKNKFIMTENYGLEFNDLALQEANTMGFDESEARKYMNRLNRDNIAQIVVLESLSRPTGSRNQQTALHGGRPLLCIVNTHLYSNNQHADVKLWQTMHLMREVQSFVTARDLATMICGDFNSEPTSAVYEFITNRQLVSDHRELQQSTNNNHRNNNPNTSSNEQQTPGHHRIQVLPSDFSSILHGLDLASAMKPTIVTNGYTTMGNEPAFTNYTANFKGTLDYIFYTPSRLKVLAITNLPDENEVKHLAGEGLPCASYPSDHLWLSCDVAMIVSGSGNILNNDTGGGGGGGHQQQHQQQQSMMTNNNNNNHNNNNNNNHHNNHNNNNNNSNKKMNQGGGGGGRK